MTSDDDEVNTDLTHQPPSSLAILKLTQEELSEKVQLTKLLCKFRPSFQSLSSDTSHLSLVRRHLHGITDWQGLGLELGLDYSDLERIDEKKGGDLDKCKTAMIHHWLQSGAATRSTLTAALKALEESSITSTIYGE